MFNVTRFYNTKCAIERNTCFSYGQFDEVVTLSAVS